MNKIMFTQLSFVTILSIVTDSDSIIDIKLNNILVNYDRDSARFSEVQLRDCENTSMRPQREFTRRSHY